MDASVKMRRQEGPGGARLRDRIAGDTRIAWRIVLAVLLLYAASFAAFRPDVVTNMDEAAYVRLAQLLSEGRMRGRQMNPFTGTPLEVLPSTYVVGTAALMTPFVWAWGWRGAFAVPLLGLVGGVLLTARWLADEKRSPLFALLVVGFVPTLVMGRVAMSDVPSLALVVLGLWLFWRGIERGWLYWLASGFVAGSSLLLRNANVLPFVPLYAGSVLRREKKCWALVVGGVAGVGVRLLTSYFFYGDPLFERVTYPFAPDTIGERLPLYLLGLLVLVPGGLVLALAYRGRRWPELRAAIVLFVVFYLFQGFSSIGTSPPKRIVLGLRYFIPLLPVLAFAMAEATPRLWRRLLAGRAREHRARLEALASTALVLGIAGVASASVIVHWGMDDWSASQAELRDEIERHAGYGTVVITNLSATAKFVEPLPSPYLPVRRAAISAKHVDYLAERHERVAIILFDRSDSQYWRNDARENEAFVRSLRRPLVLEVDRRVTATDRLRIWRVAVDRAVQR